MHLWSDLYSVDKKLLIRAGEEITPRALKALAEQASRPRAIPIADTPLFRDLRRVFRDERYATILSPPKANREILQAMGEVILPETIVKELDHIARIIPASYQHMLHTTVLSTKFSLDPHLRTTLDPTRMARLSLVHDLGKSRIPLHILDKETPITAGEFEVLKSHALIGYVLLHYYCGRDHKDCSFAAIEHHERRDGSGYPRRIKKIRTYSQIIAVADDFDALISSRPFRKEPYTQRAALDHLLDKAAAGKLPHRIVRLLIAQARISKPTLQTLRIPTGKRDTPPVDNLHNMILRDDRNKRTIEITPSKKH